MIEQFLTCPFCASEISVLVDSSIQSQDYVEDCERCCRPIEVSVRTDGVSITAFYYAPLEQ